MNGINPTYPPPGKDMVLDWMRSQGLPDPGTPEVNDWVRAHIEMDDYLSEPTCPDCGTLLDEDGTCPWCGDDIINRPR